MKPPESKLHLGCGKRKIYGYINVDANVDVCPDVVGDCSELKNFEENSITTIYACHILEHLTIEDAKKTLKRWHSLLKQHGILRISVPDFKAICEYYLYSHDLKPLQRLIHGDQTNKFNFHYVSYDQELLTKLLVEAGFKNISLYDWRSTEHFYIDDYSQCYLPKLGYATRRVDGIIDGKLMSLNVEAIKS